MNGYTQTSRIQRPSPLYRGIRYNEKPKTIRELSYPDKVTEFGRTNFPGKPMFYASSNPWAPFFELNAQEGEKIALSKWRSNAEILICQVGYTAKAFKSLLASRTCPPVVPEQYKHQNEKSPSNQSIQNFFAEEFTKIVPNNRNYLYKLTALITEKFLTVQPDCGLVYPSVAMRANAENFALQTTYVDHHLEPDNVEWYRIVKCNDFSFTVTPLNIANSFASDGKIEWKIAEEDQKRIFIENGYYVIR